MSFIKQNKTASIIIAILIVLNLTSIYFFVIHNRITHQRFPKEGPIQRHERIRNLRKSNDHAQFIQKRLGFDKAQRQQFKKLRKSHFEYTNRLRNKLRVQREFMFENLWREGFDSDSIARLIVNDQIALDKEMFNHFRSVRDICTEEQKIKFDTLIKKITKRMFEEKHRQNRKANP